MEALNYVREYFSNYTGFFSSLSDPEVARQYLPIYTAALAGIVFNTNSLVNVLSGHFNNESTQIDVEKPTILYWVSDRLVKLNILYWLVLVVYSLGIFLVTFGQPINENLFAFDKVNYSEIVKAPQQQLLILILSLSAYLFCRIGFFQVLGVILMGWCMWETTSIFITALNGFMGIVVIALLVGTPFALFWILKLIQRR
jgi:hypothetical protein